MFYCLEVLMVTAFLNGELRHNNRWQSVSIGYTISKKRSISHSP